MHLKWFRGQAVPEVMDQIRKELGPEAVILHSKQSRPRGPLGLVRNREVEILAAVDPPRAAAHATGAPVLAEAGTDGGLRAEVATLRNLLVQLGGGRLLPPALGPYYDRLVAGGVEAPVALRLLAEVPISDRDAASDPTAPERAIGDMLARMIRTVDAGIAAGPSRVALVGPAGAGKTTALAKLAARVQLGGGRAAIVDLDDSGFAEASPLEAFAAILDVPYHRATTTPDVHLQMRRAPASARILIDTPGLAPANHAELARLGDLLGAAAGDEVHLVLPATSKAADLLAAVRAFSPVGVTHLLFTRLDETTSCGSVLTVSIETGLPLSYFGTGREIPADLIPAAAGLVVQRTLTPEGSAA